MNLRVINSGLDYWNVAVTHRGYQILISCIFFSIIKFFGVV